MSVLVTVAFTVTRAVGFPADVIACETDDPAGLQACMAAGDDLAQRAAGHDVVEVWRLDPAGEWDPHGTTWGGRLVKVAVLRRSGWESV